MRKLVFLVLLICTQSLHASENGMKLKFLWQEEKTRFIFVFNEQISENQFKDFKLFNHRGTPIPIKKVLIKNKEVTAYTAPSELIYNYYTQEKSKKIYAYPSRHLLNKYFYYKDKLGPSFDKKGIFNLTIWSPTATQMTFKLFDKKNKDSLVLKRPMIRGEKGIWEIKIDPARTPSKSITNYYYQLEVTAFGKIHKGYDPYSKSLAAHEPTKDETLKSAIIDLKSTTPKGFEKSYKTNRKLLPKGAMSFIGYEGHIRDLTMDRSLDIDEKERGTYKGVMGVIPKLKSIGVTHLQLLPIQNFMTVNEYDRSYQPAELSKNHINYNWGYDPGHFFSPEGHYSSVATDPTTRVKELKEMIMELQKNNIGVIMDVVYNHLYNGIQFEAVAPGCYLRRESDGTPSAKSGAGYTFDSKIFMARRMIIDSLEYFHREFHVNGFRFDLMSFIDNDTMIAIRKRLGNDPILYGEAWEFTDLPDSEAPTKSKLPSKANLGAFNDVSRESYLAGDEGPGFILGEREQLPKVHSGITGGIKSFPKKGVAISNDSYHNFASTPSNTINYLAIHDGATAWDKINRDFKGTIEDRKRRLKQGLALLMTSQGKVVLHAGDEIGRSKYATSNDPEPKRTFTGKNEYGPFHTNSYRSSDFTNRINWTNEKHFKDIKSYLKGLIDLRKQEASLRYSSATSINKGLKFIAETPPPAPSSRISNGLKSFSELSELTLKFIGGPKDQEYYIVGEVWPGSNKNPIDNGYLVEFDSDGMGEITLSKEQISRFALKDWSNPASLQFKLVKTPGLWDAVPGAYTGMGNNTLLPSAIDKETQTALFNLKIKNHSAGGVDFTYNDYVAYTLDATLEGKSKYKNLIVIHNAGDDEALIQTKVNAKNAEILVDSDNAGTEAIKDSKIKIKTNKIFVPAHTSAVIGVH